MPPRTTDCDAGARRGRFRKAEQFADAAELTLELADEASDVADAYITLCVHSGIAAADVICCARLGRMSRGEDHNEAVELLRSADREAAPHLRTLLQMKTRAGYSHMPASANDVKRAGRAMESLMARARPLA